MAEKGDSAADKGSTGPDGVRLHILVLTSTYPRWRSDSEPAFVHELSRRLACDHDVTVLAPRSPGARRRETLDGVVIERFPYWLRRHETLAGAGGGLLGRVKQNRMLVLLLPLLFVAQVIHTARLIRRIRPDVIHAHWLIPQGLSAQLARTLAGRRVSILCTSHGGDLYGLNTPFWRWLKRRVLRRLERITVVSNAMREDLMRSYGDAIPSSTVVEVAPMGVDLQARFTPPESGVAVTNHRLLFVGRLVEKKGVDVLIRALAELRDSHPALSLDIVGDGPEEVSARTLALHLGVAERVRFWGMQQQEYLPTFYRAATLTVAPFRIGSDGDREGLGLVPVEALACGCPVVATDLPAVRDVLPSQISPLVPPDDPEALARCIASLLADPQRLNRIATQGREHCLGMFDWQVVAAGYTDRLKRLVRLHDG